MTEITGLEPIDKIKLRDDNLLVRAPEKGTKKVMIGIPMTGLLRSEWVIARYGQVIPCNWSQTDALQWLDQYSPLDFTVADARNIITYHFLKQKFEWLFFIDHDVVLPPGVVLKMSQRMMKKEVPIWAGLYFTKSVPSEPLVYRGRGSGYYGDFKVGDEVWVDGVPMGCTMIHRSIMEEMSKVSEVYQPLSQPEMAKVFETPAKIWFSPEERTWFTATGTEDLTFCTKVMEEKVLEKAGWPELQEKEFPFLIDTSIFCRHIDWDGVQYPSRGEEMQFIKGEDE